jgi:hypothetical protein
MGPCSVGRVAFSERGLRRRVVKQPGFGYRSRSKRLRGDLHSNLNTNGYWTYRHLHPYTHPNSQSLYSDTNRMHPEPTLRTIYLYTHPYVYTYEHHYPHTNGHPHADRHFAHSNQNTHKHLYSDQIIHTNAKCHSHSRTVRPANLRGI